MTITESKPNVNGELGIPLLALRPKQAAAALGISERLLWTKTNTGEIPHVRMGKSVLYPVDLLRKWLAEQAEKKGGGQ